MQGWKNTPQQPPKLCCKYLLQCKAHMLFTTMGKPFSWLHTHEVNKHFSGHEEPPGVFPARCRVRMRSSPVTWWRSNLPTSTWPAACPPLLSPLSSSVASSCSCTGGCSLSSSSTLSQLPLAREPRLLLKWCFTFWMVLSETTGKAAQITA